MHGSDPYKMCICIFDFVLNIHWRLWQVCAILARTCRPLARIQCQFNRCLQWRNVKGEWHLCFWSGHINFCLLIFFFFFCLIISITLENWWLCIICCYDRPTVTVRCFLSIWLFVFYFLKPWSKFVFCFCFFCKNDRTDDDCDKH